jgi:hypothetical protein
LFQKDFEYCASAAAMSSRPLQPAYRSVIWIGPATFSGSA